MTPLILFQYSLMVVVDILVLLFIVGVVQAMILSWFRTLIKFYFTEKESFLKRLGTAPLPYDTKAYH